MAVKEEPKDYSCMDSDDNNSLMQSLYKFRPHPPIPTIRAPNNNNNNNNNITTTNNIHHINHHQNIKHTNMNAPQLPPSMTSTMNNKQHQQQQYNKGQILTMDGQMSHKRVEPTLDHKLLSEKLMKVREEQSRAYAMHTLTEHYSSVFNYKVCIKYHDEKEVYVVRVNNNTLKDVRKKLPIRAMYRYFFKSERDEFIEIEDDNAIVPYHDKDGQKIIYCQVFPDD